MGTWRLLSAFRRSPAPRRSDAFELGPIEDVAAAIAIGADLDRLRRLASEYGVCAENVFECLSCSAGESVVEFSLDLCGQHAAPAGDERFCAECEALVLALRAIASYVLPCRAASHQDNHCLHEMRLSRSPSVRHSLRLTLLLTHRAELYAWVESAPLCLQDLLQKLRQLGIEERPWRSLKEMTPDLDTS